tara:strand:+ start:184 stop:765 length:582 start_codon:yes stop_codon:yes gene_type:complete
MFAIVKEGAITQTGPSLKGLFPNVSFPASGPDNDWKTTEGIKEIVQGTRKDQQYYFVTEGDITLVDGVPTQQYTNTAKRLADEDAKDADGNQLYVQEWDDDTEEMVDTSIKQINQGLKSVMTNTVKYNAGELLSKTDWMIIRKYERDVAIPSATATYRAAVITECARLETAITNASDVDALAVVINAQNWPAE